MTATFCLLAALIDPPAVLQLAAVDRVDHEVADPACPPQALGSLATDPSPIPGVVRGDTQGVVLAGDGPAALTSQSDALVDVADEVGSRQVGPGNGLVGHQSSLLLEPVHSKAQRDYAAGVATLSGSPRHPVGGLAQKLDSGVVVDDGLDVEGQGALLTLGVAEQADAQIRQPAPDKEGLRGVSAEAIGLVDPQLVEQTCRGVPEEPSTIGAIRHRHGARDAIVAVAGHQLDFGLAKQPAIENVGLGLDRLALALVLAADPLVGRNPPDPCGHGHRIPPRPRSGSCLGRPSTTRSAATIASWSGVHERSMSSGLASRCLFGGATEVTDGAEARSRSRSRAFDILRLWSHVGRVSRQRTRRRFQ